MTRIRQQGKALQKSSRATAEKQKPNLQKRERALLIRQFYQRHLKRRVLEQRRMREEEPYWNVFLTHNYDQEAEKPEEVHPDMKFDGSIGEEPRNLDGKEAAKRTERAPKSKPEKASNYTDEYHKSEQTKWIEVVEDDKTYESETMDSGTDGRVSKGPKNSSEDNDATVEMTEMTVTKNSQEIRSEAEIVESYSTLDDKVGNWGNNKEEGLDNGGKRTKAATSDNEKSDNLNGLAEKREGKLEKNQKHLKSVSAKAIMQNGLSNVDEQAKQFHPIRLPLETSKERRSRSIKEFSNWFEKLKVEDEQLAEGERFQRAKEEAESKVLSIRKRFTRLVEQKPIDQMEWELMYPYLDEPLLAVTLVEKFRMEQEEEERQENRNRKCLVCEDELNGTPLKAHKSEDCKIGFELRFKYVIRRYGDTKCLGCGLMRKDQNVCNCVPKACIRCFHWLLEEPMSHQQQLGICQTNWLLQQQLHRVPTLDEMIKYAERDVSVAEEVELLLRKLQFDTETLMLQNQRKRLAEEKALTEW